MSLKEQYRRRAKAGINSPGCSPAPREQRRRKKKSNTKKEQTFSTGSIEKSVPERAVSSRSAVIVPETGEPRPKEP